MINSVVNSGFNQCLSHSSETMTSNDQDDSICSICNDNLFGQNKIVITQCNHRYHESCLETWFYKARLCPSCSGVTPLPLRRVITINSNDGELIDFNDELVKICKEGNLERLKSMYTKDPDIVNQEFFSLKSAQSFPLAFFAIGEGHINIVEFLISNGADINAPLNNDMSVLCVGTTFLKCEMSALHIACERGRLDMVEFLFSHGAKADKKDSKGSTPLGCAVGNGCLDIIKFLIKNNSDIHVVNHQGNNLLHIAAVKGRQEVVKFLLDEGCIDDCLNYQGQTAFQMACIHGHQDLAEFMLEKQGGDVNYLTETLQFASMTEHKHIVEFLSMRGAMVNGVVQDNLSSVCDNESRYYPPLHMAIVANDQGVAECLLEQGAQVNILNYCGESALTVAVKKGRKNSIKLLLDNQIRVDATDIKLALYTVGTWDLDLFKSIFGNKDLTCILLNKFDSFLHLAVRENNCQLIEYLITEKNIEVNVWEYPLISVAINNDNIKTVECLLKYDADINAFNKELGLCSPIEYAIFIGSVSMLDYLIRRGANVADSSFFYWDGVTALVQAVRKDDCRIIQCLIDHNVLIDENVRGESPLHLAVRLGNLNVIKCLCENGANVSKKDDKNNSPLDIARQEVKDGVNTEYAEIVEILEERLPEPAQEDDALFLGAALPRMEAMRLFMRNLSFRFN